MIKFMRLRLGLSLGNQHFTSFTIYQETGIRWNNQYFTLELNDLRVISVNKYERLLKAQP